MNKLCRIFSRFSVEICLTFHGLDHCTVTIWLLLLFLSKLITCNGDYNIIIIVCYYHLAAVCCVDNSSPASLMFVCY